jgi:alginate O-acetyltransferase complex protein AlgI
LLFNSLTYVFFLPAVVLGTWALPARFRAPFLLAASYTFYADWNPPFLALIVGMTVVNYWLGLAQARRAPRSRLLLALAVAFNLATLGTFKYLGLLDATALSLTHAIGLPASWPVVRLILPLGLSFFTFEFIHYQVDLYRGFDPIRSPIDFALFPAFFPTQIAGPIKRYQDFEAQVRSQPSFEPGRFLEGLELIALGMVKKIVLADSLLPIADTVFSGHAQAGALDSWVGVLAFSFQIYLDFSGYTDIGRGSAQLLGYTVPVNFRAPYLATSVRDFWRRWHISLSSWLRDYLYFPLGGNRKGPWRTRFNLLATMALGGLWHGAAWHFVAWGFAHGLALVTNREVEALSRVRVRVPGWIGILGGWAATQLAVLLLWVLFRAPSTGDALAVWRHMAGLAGGGSLLSAGDRWTVVAIAGGVLSAQLVLQRLHPRQLLTQSPASVVLRPAYVTVLVLLAAQFASLSGVVHRFIYFQF